MQPRAKAFIGPAIFLALLLVAEPASAFCGFFVGGTNKLYNDATQVVLMRAGTDTVLSMRPDYSGPVENFAMVVPVPQVLEKENVRTLKARAFQELDRLSQPRLVEYHEQDPCAHHLVQLGYGVAVLGARGGGGFGVMHGLSASGTQPPPVRIKAQFSRAEYEIVILDADESTSLEAWLNEHGYQQPPGAAAALAPYIQEGSYFFAAKVDASKVKFGSDGKALLSPLQFHYSSERFQLPIRLGLLNAKGKQDLLIYVLADHRYKAANRPNAFIPTNINVSHKRKNDFDSWYDDLFERQTKGRETTVVTEYVWPTSIKCDPCPPGASVLSGQTVADLGGQLLAGKINPRNLVLTRMHTRYGTAGGTSDIVFEKADPVVGGREEYVNGKLEQGGRKSGRNSFQARYSIRFKWRGAITCEDPRRGIWSSHMAVLAQQYRRMLAQQTGPPFKQ